MKEAFSIGARAVGEGDCLVIAEIGPNHDGDVAIAHALIDAAAQAGCDGVKFQYRSAEDELFDRTTKSYYYDEPRFNFIKRVQEFDHEIHRELREHTRDAGLLYICSAMCEETVDSIGDLGSDAIKIAVMGVGRPINESFWLLSILKFANLTAANITIKKAIKEMLKKGSSQANSPIV